MSTEAKTITSGRVAYRIEVVPDPQESRHPLSEYSPELTRLIMRHNTPPERTVTFDGHRSRTEEVNVDHGFRGRAVVIGHGGGKPLIYCKELRFSRFCVRQAPEPAFTREETVAPEIEALDGRKQIAGHTCRQVRYVDGDRSWILWVAHGIRLLDPTGAVITREGVPGAILEIEQIPGSGDAVAHRRTTVTQIAESAVSGQSFEVPDGFEEVASLAEARATNRERMLTAAAAAPPLDDTARARLAGWWRLESPTDVVLLEVTPSDGGTAENPAFTLVTHNRWTGKQTRREARLHGQWLVVEQPPGFALYSITADGALHNLDHEVFRYRKISAEEAAEALSRH